MRAGRCMLGSKVPWRMRSWGELEVSVPAGRHLLSKMFKMQALRREHL